MSEHKFTPGPWTVREVDGQGFAGQIGYAIDFNEDQEQVVDFVYEEADAHLIAAAPDLLEALQEVMDCWLYGAAQPDKQKAISLAQQAIAKALGNQ